MTESFRELVKPSLGGGLCNMTVNGVLAFFFFRYSFMNPDVGSCWAMVGKDTAKGSDTPGYTEVSE